MYIDITEKMEIAANNEAKKRNPYIKHHFEVQHLTGKERDIIGFLGEFAACNLLGIDWENNIRDNYFTIDNGDGVIGKGIFDVKTETIPNPYFTNLLNKNIQDNGVFGRRLIHQGQAPLLLKYDIVIFGAFLRGDYSKWFPIGYLETDFILKNYKVTSQRPDGGKYPFAALPIKTSDLKSVNELFKGDCR